MTDKSEERVFRNLPSSYRRAGEESAAFIFTRSLSSALGELERTALQVMNSRFLEHLNDLGDAERLAALFELAPWPEEELEAFRARVRLLARLYLQGAATAGGMLELFGAAYGLHLLGKRPPSAGDRYATTGDYSRGTSDQKPWISAKVVDLPLTTRYVNANAPDYKWIVENNMYGELPSIDEKGRYIEGTGPDPIIDIKAGSHPVVLPVVVNQDLRRLVLVNRFIPPGATLRVDLNEYKVMDLAGPSTLPGPLLHEGQPAPNLLYGTGGLTGDGEAELLSGEAAKPFHVLKWHTEHRRDADMPQVPGPPGSLRPVPDDGIPWPPLVTIGTSRWRLMRGIKMDGVAPELAEALEHSTLRVMPQNAASGPAELTFWWIGRRLATFTVQFDEKLLWDAEGADPKEKDRLKQWKDRRKIWFREQIERLKLAGVLYVDQDDLGKMVMPSPPKEQSPNLSLWETIRPADKLETAVKGGNRKAALSETLLPVDSVMIKVGKPVLMTDAVRLSDEVAVEVTGPILVDLAEKLLLTDEAAIQAVDVEIEPAHLELAEKLLLADSVTAQVVDVEIEPAHLELAEKLLLADSVTSQIVDVEIEPAHLELAEKLLPRDEVMVNVTNLGDGNPTIADPFIEKLILHDQVELAIKDER
ncbi:hypothetical protein E5161_07160 [Cohnella pontilimi]|uniref:Uncharacterized protein n=1 Tax=Cohnella pontilimi TaxID=2564100 RepID=A0A4U0FEB0_9BACL|nr:hypothetical protein [Cohnella pontilimi]TJY42624.1 hypothetical protein E5161_07160 [Cohnella pontilimi]